MPNMNGGLPDGTNIDLPNGSDGGDDKDVTLSPPTKKYPTDGDTGDNETSSASKAGSQSEMLYMILGIVVGVMMLLLIVFMFMCWWKQRQQRRMMGKLEGFGSF